MTDYVGVTTTIIGYTATEPRPPAYDKDGSRGVIEVPIAINEGYKPKDGSDFVKTGVTWYTVSASGEYADVLRAIPKGSKIKVDDAKQEVREYKTKDGETKLGIGLRYGTVTVLETGENSGGF